MGLGDFRFTKTTTDESNKLSEEMGESSLWASLLGLAGTLTMMAIPGFGTMGLAAKGGLSSLGSLLGNIIGRTVKPISDDYTLMGDAPQKGKQEIIDAGWLSTLTAGITPVMGQMLQGGEAAGKVFQSAEKAKYAELFGPQLKGTDLWSKSMITPGNLVQGGLPLKDAASLRQQAKERIQEQKDRPFTATDIDEALSKPDVVTDSQGNILLEGQEATDWINEGKTGDQYKAETSPKFKPLELPSDAKNLSLEDSIFDQILSDNSIDDLFRPNKINVKKRT